MSTWIFDRPLIKTTIGLVLVVGLSACTSSRLGGGRSTPTAVPQKSTITVSGKEIVIEGPSGFCMDHQATQVAGDNAFVLMGNCAVVSPKTRAPAPEVKALLTATVSGAPQQNGTIADSMNSMDRFFRSEIGRTALSRTSDAATVQILDTFQNDDVFYLRANDTSDGIVPGASNDYWRAYFDLHEQILSVSVIGFTSDPLEPNTGLATVRDFANRIRTQNGAQVIASQVVEETTNEEPEQQPLRKVRDPARTFWTIGLLRRILN